MKKIIYAISIVLSIVIIGLSTYSIGIRYNWWFSNHVGKIHLSIDDTLNIFQDLTKNKDKYNSIFDNYTLGYLNRLHKDYGACFSMYCYYENNDFSLDLATDKFAEQFSSNSDWLKFNYHAKNSQNNLNNETISNFTSNYCLFLNEIKRITGDNSIDKYIRLNYFCGSKEICSYLSSTCGITGLYAADDGRNSYYLTSYQCQEIREKDYYYDSETNLLFRNTDLRLDNNSNPFHYLVIKKNNDDFIEVFTHEWLINGFKGKSIWKLEEVCIFAKNYHKVWSF